MDEQTYAAIPERLTVREVRTPVRTPGCRVEEVVAMTTLLDAAAYSRKEVVGDRPDRCEPRAVKRRPKSQALLTAPRAEARAALLRG